MLRRIEDLFPGLRGSEFRTTGPPAMIPRQIGKLTTDNDSGWAKLKEGMLLKLLDDGGNQRNNECLEIAIPQIARRNQRSFVGRM